MSPTATTSDRLLAEIVERRSAPVATVVVPAPAADEDMRARLDIRAKDVRRRLRDAELPDAVVDQVVDALGDDVGDEWIGVVADAEGLVTATLVDGREEIVEVGALPRFVPFVRDRWDHRPHVVVRCDRIGAHVARVQRGEIERDTEVEGVDAHVQKVRAGGWSHRRFQAHSEHTWELNAKDIAEQVLADAEAIDAEMIVVTGDLHAVRLVAENVPEAWKDRLVLDDREPTDEASDAAVFERAETLMRDRAAREIVAALERYAEHRGRGDRAAEGVEDVFAALRGGAVEVLLVSEDVGETAFVAVDDPRQVATDQQQLADSGFADTVTSRVTDAAILAALSEGADVVICPAHGPDAPKGALGAILRF
ncbi:MAG: Vms1/Ankzf1 family peptidyl-tRNA hydrolase [Acidimicrobiia bacterium]